MDYRTAPIDIDLTQPVSVFANLNSAQGEKQECNKSHVAELNMNVLYL